MGRVGRFPVMATLQAARALALGLGLDEAKSWGLNRAVFYAAAKRGFDSPRPRSGKTTRDREAEESRRYNDDMYTLGGEKAYMVPDRRGGLRFRFGDDEQTPEDFDAQVIRRFADWESAWNEALAIVRSAPCDDLESQHRFFDHVYKPRRNELAAKWTAAGRPAKLGSSR